MVSKIMNCKYHTQDRGIFCGPASAMMVLAEINGNNPAGIDQDDLDIDIQEARREDIWVSDPHGMNATMTTRGGKVFTLERDTDEPTGSGRIVNALFRDQVSAIVPVGSNGHWCVVCGVETDVDPLTSANYTIQGFWVNNPVTHFCAGHTPNDTCGSGSDLGWQSQFVTYEDWKRYWFIGYGTPTEFITITDPSAPTFNLPTQVEQKPAWQGSGLVPSQEILRLLETEFQPLFQHKQIAGLAGKFAKPTRVRRLNRKGDSYYLSPALEQSKVRGYAQSDGLRGNILNVLSTESAGTEGYELDPTRVTQALIDHADIQLPKEKGGGRWKEGDFKLDPDLVWRPCLESHASYLPFWRIVAARGRTFYLRIDQVKENVKPKEKLNVLSRLTVGGLGL